MLEGQTVATQCSSLMLYAYTQDMSISKQLPHDAREPQVCAPLPCTVSRWVEHDLPHNHTRLTHIHRDSFGIAGSYTTGLHRQSQLILPISNTSRVCNCSGQTVTGSFNVDRHVSCRLDSPQDVPRKETSSRPEIVLPGKSFCSPVWWPVPGMWEPVPVLPVPGMWLPVPVPV